MMTNSTCTKCDSTKIVPDAQTTAFASGGPLSVYVNANPGAMLFKETHAGHLKACVCGECGHVELYVENAKELYEAYCKSQQQVGTS